MKQRARTIVLTCGVIAASTASNAIAQRTFADQRGREWSFANPAARVITIAIPLYWIFATVDGGTGRMVAANPVAVSQVQTGVLDAVFPRRTPIATDIVRGGTFTPNVEALLALKPDAIFQWADRGDTLMSVLDRAGLPAIGVKNTGSEDDIDRWIRMSGAVAGRDAQAEALIAWMQDGNRRFARLTAGLAASQRPKVLMLSEFSRTITANGPNSYVAPMIQRAGGINAATTDGQVGIEQVLQWNPDIILLTPFESKTPAAMFADARWQRTAAVATKRVYKLPFGITRWGGYGPESPLFLAWLTEIVHPGRFGLSFRTEAKEAFAARFNYQLSDSELDRILQMPENNVTAHYGAFAADGRR